MKSLIKKIILYPSKIINTIHNLFFLFMGRVKYGRSFTINGRIFLRNHGTLTIGDSVTINSSFAANPIGGDTNSILYVAPMAVLRIGNNFKFSNSTIFCKNHIEIGNDVMIGGSCKIYDSDFHSVFFNDRIILDDINSKSKPIYIEDGAFIGAHSIILKGVTIGTGSVIGAGSVLTRSTGPNELWAGNPAKFIKSIYVGTQKTYENNT